MSRKKTMNMEFGIWNIFWNMTPQSPCGIKYTLRPIHKPTYI